MLISFDFDNTLWDEFAFTFTDSLNTLKDHLAKGDRVVVVTSRKVEFANEAKILLSKVGVNVEVFSCPWDLDNGETWEERRNKSEMLIDLGASVHFDDMHTSFEFDDAREAGIAVLPPPHWGKGN